MPTYCPWTILLLLLLSLVFLYGSNLQASVQKHLYKPVTGSASNGNSDGNFSLLAFFTICSFGCGFSFSFLLTFLDGWGVAGIGVN